MIDKEIESKEDLKKLITYSLSPSSLGLNADFLVSVKMLFSNYELLDKERFNL